MNNTDILVVGCGLTGAVIARELAEKGKKVEIWERRNHIAGNMYDFKNEHGILVQLYGPHAFHTDKKEIYDYIQKYEDWNEFILKCGAEIDKIQTPTPFNFTTIDTYYSIEDARKLKEEINKCYAGQATATVVELLEHENKIIRSYAEFLFEKDYSLYTAKQWGINPKDVDPSILKRVPVRFSYEEGYFGDKYQVMPKNSFTKFFENLLDHENIIVKLNIDAKNHIKILDNRLYINGEECVKPIIYTGAIDEFFENKFGQLPYRSLRFEWKHENVESYQDYPVIAYPQEEGFTRITEYKKLPNQNIKGTTYVLEYPLNYNPNKEQEPYYPVLTKESQEKYINYLDEVNNIKNLYCCGRLGDFKYYNMDQAIERALEVSKKILKRENENE